MLVLHRASYSLEIPLFASRFWPLVRLPRFQPQSSPSVWGSWKGLQHMYMNGLGHVNVTCAFLLQGREEFGMFNSSLAVTVVLQAEALRRIQIVRVFDAYKMLDVLEDFRSSAAQQVG